MNDLQIWGMGVAIGIMIGTALRKFLVPITPDGRTEIQIQEEAYEAGFEAGERETKRWNQ